MPTLNHAGIALHYDRAGESGPPVLLIQGVGAVGRVWRPQIDALANDHRALAFDNRGIGASTPLDRLPAPLDIRDMAADALALATHAFGEEPVHVVGHSMGGVIAQRLAITHPSRVRSLSLLCTVANGAEAVAFGLKTMIAAVRTRLGPRPARRRAFLGLIYPKHVLAGMDPAALAALASQLGDLFGRDLADQPPILTKQAMALRAHDCTPELAKLATIPTLVASAEHDPITTTKSGRALAKAIPDARYVELKDLSHAAPLHRPDLINDLLSDHLGQAAWR